MKDFLELCKNRRSIRQYTDEVVSKEQIEYILKCALMAPSSKRCNPWEFVVITDRTKIASLATCRTYGSQMLLQTNVAIVVAVDSSLTDTWQCDGAIVAQNILLAAEDLGLGACWCHIYNREGAEVQVRALTNIPEKYSILCLISIGHKNEERKPYDESKLLYNKVHYETF